MNMDLAIIFERLGTIGAGDASTYERAAETWLDGTPIPTLETCMAMHVQIELEEARDRRRAAIATAFDTETRAAFVPTALGFTVDATYDGVRLLRDLVDLATRAGILAVSVWDINGDEHTVATDHVNAAVTEIGERFYDLESRRRRALVAIDAASTAEGVEQVVL